MKKNLLLMASILSLSLLTACSSTPKEEPKTAEGLFQQAQDYLQKTSYTKAAETFEKVELEHPYSALAAKSRLMAAYAYYEDKKYDDAIIALDRFIKYHPGNKDIAYAYYLKAMCYYEQIVDVSQDQSNTQKAMQALREVIIRFPNTEYAKDARLKLDLTVDHMAGQEMSIGRWYLGQENYLSALNRFSTVVNQYQTTTQIEEALYRQVEIYTILGLNTEAQKAYQVLEYNYPKSKWTKQAMRLIEKGMTDKKA